MRPELTLVVEPASDGAGDPLRGSMGGGVIAELAKGEGQVSGNGGPTRKYLVLAANELRGKENARE